MVAPAPTPAAPSRDTSPGAPISAARIALSLVVVLGGLAALLFVPAGRLDWVEAWALIAAYTAFLAVYTWWALLPGAAIGLVFVLRTAKEDQMLWVALAGYSEYARRVRYRLVPGVW